MAHPVTRTEAEESGDDADENDVAGPVTKSLQSLLGLAWGERLHFCNRNFWEEEGRPFLSIQWRNDIVHY